MTYCPQCMTEYRPGLARCDACDVDLVEDLLGVELNVKRASSDSTVRFFLLTYVITWGCTAICLAGGPTASGPRLFASRTLLLLGSFAPSIAALGLTASAEGLSGAKALLKRLFDWRLAVRWHVVPFLYPLVILLSANVAHRAIAGAWVRLSELQWLPILSTALLLMPLRASEEIGWRGYALPRLAKTVGLGKASLILGPIWACWHLPLFLIPGMASYGQSAAMFMLGSTALSVGFAWLYGNTNGSLLPVTLMHSVMDEAFTVLPKPSTVENPFAFGTELMPWLITALEWLIAACMLARMSQTGAETGTQGESVAVDRH